MTAVVLLQTSGEVTRQPNVDAAVGFTLQDVDGEHASTSFELRPLRLPAGRQVCRFRHPGTVFSVKGTALPLRILRPFARAQGLVCSAS